MAEKITYTKARDAEWPLCPYCKKELREIMYKQRGWLSAMTTFWCPHCRSLLSTSTTFNG
jgi:glutaredoxin